MTTRSLDTGEFMRAHRQNCHGVPEHPILLLGEDNPQSPLDEEALWPHKPGVAGDRLQRILGLPLEHYLGTWRTNLVLGANKWSKPSAEKRAAQLLCAEYPPWDVIVVLGAKVAGVVEFMGGPLPCSERRGHLTLVYIPHPSGVSRAWNDPMMVERTREVLRSHCPSTWPIGTWKPAAKRRRG